MDVRFPILLISFAINASLNAQTREYNLVSKTERADFNYKALYLLDDVKTKEGRREVFNPIVGNYIVYIFIASFEGLSYTDEKKIFNDILIVKTDRKKKIIDAYQYTLEWSEPPMSYDLYKATKPGLILTDRFSIDKLKFQRVDFYSDTDKYFCEPGILLM